MLHTKLSLPSNLEMYIWKYYKLMKMQAFVLIGTLFFVFTIQLLHKHLPFKLYRLHKLPLFNPNLQKSFQCDLPNKYLAIRSHVQYITFPRDDDTLSCTISTA